MAGSEAMRVLVTGATGFIGKNLIEQLQKMGDIKIDQFCSASSIEALRASTRHCDFVYHLAAVHRPANVVQFSEVNIGLTENLLQFLKSNRNRCPVLLSSSIQAGDETAYGASKRSAEEALKAHAAETGARAMIYRLTNTFGRYARPNQHSVVATFCYNIARDLPIKIYDPQKILYLYYIDDVIDSFTAQLQGDGEPDADGFYRLPASLTYAVSLQELADQLYFYKLKLQDDLKIEPGDDFRQKLFATYLSYLPAVD